MGVDLWWISQQWRGCVNPKHQELDRREKTKAEAKEMKRQKTVLQEKQVEAERECKASFQDRMKAAKREKKVREAEHEALQEAKEAQIFASTAAYCANRRIEGEVRARRKARQEGVKLGLEQAGATNPPQVNERGMQKQTEGKLRMEALPWEFKDLLARHMAYGAFTKVPPYEIHNWRKGGFDTELLAAAERHILAHQKGEEVDAESGSLHLVAAAANLLMIAAVKE